MKADPGPSLEPVQVLPGTDPTDRQNLADTTLAGSPRAMPAVEETPIPLHPREDQDSWFERSGAMRRLVVDDESSAPPARLAAWALGIGVVVAALAVLGWALQ